MHHDPIDLIVRRRRIAGMSAVFLPFMQGGGIDWDGFARHLQRTIDAGLVPAVNMDTGSVQFLGDADRRRVLDIARSHTVDFVAGACVRDSQGDPFDSDAYRRMIFEIVERRFQEIRSPTLWVLPMPAPALM